KAKRNVNINVDKAEHEFVGLLDNKIQFVIGAYSIGKEKVFW
ncbi:5008_t:CDS:1, partial [Gigaspora margarita]